MYENRSIKLEVRSRLFSMVQPRLASSKSASLLLTLAVAFTILLNSPVSEGQTVCEQSKPPIVFLPGVHICCLHHSPSKVVYDKQYPGRFVTSPSMAIT
jgi:hypothetical protein